MAEANMIASLDDFQGNDCSFVADRLEAKGYTSFTMSWLGLENFINV